MKKFEEEFNYLIELSGKALTGQIEAEKFEEQRAIFLNEYVKKQQPEIPEFVAELIEERGVPEDGAFKNYVLGSNEHNDALEWINNHQRTWLLALLNDYTVKEKRFYLKDNRELESVGDTCIGYVTLYLKNDGYLTTDKTRAGKFTQQEIDSMETGSYEQIEVQE